MDVFSAIVPAVEIFESCSADHQPTSYQGKKYEYTSSTPQFQSQSNQDMP